eukprot:8802634-Pyramimonas_sp.AAC.1
MSVRVPRLGPLLGPSGPVAHFWAVPGASWAVLVPSWAVLEPLWGLLGLSWGDLGGLCGRGSVGKPKWRELQHLSKTIEQSMNFASLGPLG